MSTATSPAQSPRTPGPEQVPMATTVVGRLYHGETAVDFVGRRKIGAIISGILLVLTVLSLFSRGLNFGIDFEGGVAWDVPAAEFTVDDAEQVLADHGLDASEARIQERSSDSGDIIKIQVGDQPDEVRSEIQAAFAEAAGVSPDEVSANSVSSSWGRDITEKAARALVIFIIVVAAFISVRFEWRMALAAILAMIHDVVISVGIYSLFGFLVTPATVIAFLTILGYSLYDTIVVFDRIRENEARFAAHKVPYADVVNVSMNQVLMRSLNTSISSILPVLSLLIVGTWIMGATTLSEFAIALLVGMVAGVYSSFYVAVPLLAIFKGRMSQWKANSVRPRALGAELRALVMGGTPVTRRARATVGGPVVDGAVALGAIPATGDEVPVSSAEALLTHAPRPRKKKRR